MATETSAKATLHQRAVRELKELVFISIYLYITLGAVILMKTAVLHSEGVAFTPWGIAIIKAVVLAKFMLLGNAMKLGERTTTRPLIWPTLHKAFAFLVLLMIMTTIEEAVVGLFHRQSIAASLGELFGPRLQETIAGYLIMLLVLMPYSAFMAPNRCLAKAGLRGCFLSSGSQRSRGDRRSDILQVRRVGRLCGPNILAQSAVVTLLRTARAQHPVAGEHGMTSHETTFAIPLTARNSITTCQPDRSMATTGPARSRRRG